MEVENLRNIYYLNKLTILVTKAAIILKEINKISGINKISISKNKKRKRSCHAREEIRTRNVHGFYAASFLEMKNNDSEEFFKYTRMNVRIFTSLLELIKPEIENERSRKSLFIGAECRLAITLIYLSRGDSVQKLAISFKLGKETVRLIILETTDILCHVWDSYCAEPEVQELEEIANDFNRMWDFPNCIGAIGGKYIALQSPSHSVCKFLDTKKSDCIALMAACDARYRFTFVDIRAHDSQKDADVFQNSSFGQKIINGSNEFPPSKELPETGVMLPHFFVADGSFLLALHLMTPYDDDSDEPENEYFNNRLCRATNTMDNAFGILIARWRILQQKITMHANNAEKIVKACVLLHNFIMYNMHDDVDYINENYIDREDINGVFHNGLWRSEIDTVLPQIQASNTSNAHGGASVMQMRNILRRHLILH